MVNIAIYDNDEKYVCKIINFVKTVKEKYEERIAIYCFECPDKLLRVAQKEMYDYAFLDICLEGDFKIAQSLILFNRSIKFIFLSDNEDLIFKSFSYNPLGFVRKSRFKYDMYEVLGSLDDEIRKRISTYEILVDRKKIFILLEDVMYVEARGNYLTFCMNVGQLYKTRMTVKYFMENLNTSMFCKVNAGCVINMKYLQKIEKRRVVLRDGKDFSIGRGIYSEVCTICEKFLLK